MRKSYTRAVRTGRVMMVFGGMTPRLQLSHSDSGARRPSPHSSSKSADTNPSAQPVELKPEVQHDKGLIINIQYIFASVCVCVCLEYLTEDVGLKAVLLKEGHVAVAFTTGISNQTPVNKELRIKGSVQPNYIKTFSLLALVASSHKV